MSARRVIFVVALAALLGTGGSAAAKSKKELTYSYPVVWSAAVRMLRADKGYKITDKDKETGYILFVYPKNGAAALEILKIVDGNGYRRVRLQLRVPKLPSYMEAALLDALERKLREEQGPAPEAEKVKPKRPRRPKKPKPPKGDKGAKK